MSSTPMNTGYRNVNRGQYSCRGCMKIELMERVLVGLLDDQLAVHSGFQVTRDIADNLVGARSGG